MAPKRKKNTKIKVKKKKWVPIFAPSIFNNVLLGETYVSEDEKVLDKQITLNLMPILNDMRKQGYEARFKVTSYSDGKANTAIIGLKMTNSAVKRLVRRGRTKIDDSFLAKLKTGEIVRVKPLVITQNRCSKEAQTAIRLSVRNKLKTILRATTLESFIREIINNKATRVLKEEAKKHHPIRTVDIRYIGVISSFIDKIGKNSEKEIVKEELRKTDENREAKANN